MATASESSIQYERDLRSNHQDDKRYKDHNKKWAHKGWGHRPLAGVPYNTDVDVTALDKVRPSKPWGHDPTGYKRNHNVNKGSGKWQSSSLNGKIREKVHAKAEINESSRSVVDFLPSSRGGRSTQSDTALYSFDATESPAAVVSLEVFVKPNTKATEKFVEQEYEVLDVNGDVVKGRKAMRRHLRKAASASPEANPEEKLVEVDGFELV